VRTVDTRAIEDASCTQEKRISENILLIEKTNFGASIR
jgi:hypothetical protein